MQHLLQFTILLGSFLTSKSATINSTTLNQTDLKAAEIEQYVNETAIQIETLQNEKDDLYKKINKAIDEAIPDLERTNDTEAVSGLEHLKTLKQQLKEIHEADSDDEEPVNSNEINSTDFRRHISISIDREGVGKKGDWLSKIKKDEFFQKLIKTREKKYNSLPNVLNRQKIANQIQQWLTKKAEEKKKVKEFKAKMKIDYEKCPDFGKGRPKKRGRNKKKTRNTFPCCRKCCKKSYLGCL